MPCWRLLSISPTSSDSVMFRRPEISFMPFQKASSRLTLVLWPATTIERLTTGDFMTRLRHRCVVLVQHMAGAILAMLVERAFGFGAAETRTVGVGLLWPIAPSRCAS